MSPNTIEESKTTETGTPQAKRTRKLAKKAKVAKKAHPAKKVAGNSKAEPANKKAEVIEMMKRPKGAMLTEIMATTGWQAHTVRGFVSILASKGGHTTESSKNSAGDRTYKIAK